MVNLKKYKVKNIKKIGFKDTYNFSCKPHPYYFANDILSHNCFNPELWDKNGGEEISLGQLKVKLLKFFEWCDNVVFQGGEPTDQESDLIELAKWAKRLGKNVWCYSGKDFEEISEEIKENCDVIKCGRYIDSLKTDMPFRGSSNQILYRKEKGEWISA
jgi:anaerobic ribonucleoside-triphosphate reductase activating protein